MNGALIVKPFGSEKWFKYRIGSFLECKAEEKRVKAQYKETKVIYQENILKYIN